MIAPQANSRLMAEADTDSPDRAEAIANASLAVFASINAGVEALTVLRQLYDHAGTQDKV